MIEEGLVVKFLGDAGPLEKAAQKAEQSLDEVSKTANSTAAGLDKVSSVSAKASQAAAGLSRAVNTAGGAIDKTAKSSNSAVYTLSNLSRVAQDAPYGFIGIANNLNPLLEGFQRLQAESGGTKTALAALGGALSGPAGIGLALGVVSSLLVAFGGNLFSSGKEVDAFKTEMDALNATLADTQKGIDNISNGLDFANKLGSINNELAGFGKVNDLGAQVIATRQAIDDIAPSVQDLFTKKISLQVDLEGTTDSKLRDEITQRLGAITKAYEEANGKLQRLKDQERILQVQRQLEEKKDADDALKAAEDANRKRIAAQRKHLAELARLAEEARQWQRTLNQIMADYRNPDTSFVPKAQDNSGLISQFINNISATRTGNEAIDLPIKPELDFADFEKKYTALFASLGKKLNVKAFAAPLTEIPKLFEQIKEQVQNTVALVDGVLTPAFQNLFTAILAGEPPLKSFFQSIGQSVLDLINKLMAAALQALIVSALTGGGTSFAKAFGDLTGFKFGKHAAGGIAYGPSLGWIGEYANAGSDPEVIAPLSKLKGMMGGGMGFPDYLPILSGDQLLLMSQRAAKKQGRTG